MLNTSDSDFDRNDTQYMKGVEMTIPDHTVHGILRNLTNFGYGSLTFEGVREKVDAIERGEPGSDIITKFATTMLIEAKLIPDPDAS